MSRGTAQGLVAAAERLRRAGQLAAARAAFSQAAAAAERSGNTDVFVTAALGVGGFWVYEQRDVVARAELAALWERAAHVVGEGSLAASRLRARLAAEAVYDGGPVDAVALAVEEVRRFGDDGATAEALSLLHHVRLTPDHARDRLATADEIVRLGARAGDGLLALMGLCWRTVDFFLVGNPRGSQSLAELTERAKTSGCEALSFVADVLAAMLLARAGRLEEAESAAGAAADRGAAAGDPDAGAYFGALLATVRWWQGRADEVVPLVRTLSSSPRLGFNDHVYVAADAVLSASVGDIDGADEALARLAAVGLRNLPDSSSWLTTLALVAEASYLVGDPELCAEAAELMAPFSHLPVMPSLAVVCLGSVERFLGLAAAATGSWDEAVAHLDAAVMADRRLGNRPMSVLTEHTLAGVLRARGGPGDDVWADHLSGRAATRAEPIGMVLPSHPAWLTARRPSRPVTPRRAVLHRTPGAWRVELDGEATMLPERVGLGYLGQLLAHPGQDLDAVCLAAGGTYVPDRSDAVLDAAAMRSYRSRAQQLRATLERNGLSAVETARARTELETLRSAISAAGGLGGRVRSFPTSQERARTAVRKALLRAIDSLGEVDPDLGRHLLDAVTTGATCCYRPTPEWQVLLRPSRPSLVEPA